MADWLDDPELYKPAKAPKSGGDDWLDDPALYSPAPEGFVDSVKRRISEQSAKSLGQRIREIPADAIAGGESLLRGIGSGLNTLGGTAALIGGMPVGSALDAIARAGGQPTGYADAVGDYVTESFGNADSIVRNDPRAANPENQIASALGNVIPDLATAYLTGGESAAIKPLVQQSVRGAVAREAEQIIGQGARASVLPSVERGSQLGTQVIDAGGTPIEALGAFGTGAAANSMAYMVPGAASGSLPVRAIEGAIVEPVAGRIQNDVENLALPDRLGLDQQYDARAAFMDAFLGGGLSAGMGGRPQERFANPDAMRGTPEDIASREIETALDEETFANRPAAPLGERMAPVAAPEPSVADADAPFRRPDVPAPVAPEVVAAEAPVAPEPPVAPVAERLYSDYNPEASQQVTRVDGNLSFPESRLTRRALDDALSDPDPVNAAERLLTNIAEQPDIRPEQKWLAETLAPLMKPLGVKLIEPNPSQPYAGAYSNTDNTVYIRQADPETALHETFHGVTSALITNKAARSNPVVGKAVRELDDMLGHLTGGLGLGEIDTSGAHPEVQRLLKDKQGPLSNTKEFVTYGLTNRPFQDWLRSLPPPPGRTEARNMWEYFKQAVASMFGKMTPQQRSFLDALIETGADLTNFAAANPAAVRVAQAAEAGKLRPVAEMAAPAPAVTPPPVTPPKPAPAAPAPQQRPPTSTKNAFVDADRERAGKEPITRATPRSNETTLEMGKAAIADNPDLPAELIARLSVSGVSSINSVEEAALQVESERLRAERDRQADRAADPALTESARAIARQKFDEAEAAIDQIDAATRNSGTEWGRFGQYRQRALRDDYTLAALERKARAVKGEPLTGEETGKLREMADTIAKQQKRLESAQKRLDEYESGAAVAQTYKRLLEDMRKPRGPVDVAALKERAERAKAALRELAGTDAAVMVDAATLTPQQALIDLGAYHYADGGKTLADWTKRMEADVPAQYREGLADLFELSKAGAARPVIEPGKLTHKNVYDLALAEVRNGVKGEDAVMKAVFEAVRADNPGITERDVRRLFTEYGKQRFPTRDSDRARVSELKSLVKMEESIKRMEDGLAPMKGAPRAARSEEIKQRQAEYSAARKAFERKFPDPDADARYQRGRATSLSRQLAEVQERLRTGDYEKAVRIPKELNEANTKAAYELQQAKDVFLQKQFEWEMEKRSPLKKLFGRGQEALNLARAVMTSFDLSAVLRQGGFISMGRPEIAAKSFIPMLKAFASKEGEFRVKHDLETRTNAPLYKSSGLELTDTGSGLKLSKLEEAFMSRWIEKIPKAIGGGFLRGSQRAFTTFLNKLRADTFDTMIAALAKNGSKPTPAEAKAIANYINVATGRGKIGFGDHTTTATGLNTVFFAPRLVASRFNMLLGQPLYGGTARTRKLVAAEYARFLTGVAAIMGLGALAHDDDDDDKPFISFDPRSSDFGKMRFGKTYIDPLAGLAQMTTFLFREGMGESVTGSGNVVPLREKYRLANLWRDEPLTDKPGYGGQNAYDVAARFARTKLAPIPGAIVNTLTGEDVVGQPVTPGQTVGTLVTPLSMQNVADVMSEHGVPAGTAITMLELLGMGVQYRDPAQMKAADYKSMSREEKNTYSAYVQEAQKIKKAKSDLQDFANSLPEDMSAGDIRYEVEKKAEELGLKGATVDAYKRDTTARDDKGNRRRGVKRSETGSVKMNWKQAYSLSGYSAADKTVSAIDSDIEALDEDDITNAELEKIYGKYAVSPLTDGGDTQASDDDIEAVRKTLRWQRKCSQDNFVKEREK